MRFFLLLAITAILMQGCNNKKATAPADPDLYYTCSMDPQVRENKPGKCPICKMELTPARKSNNQHADEIELSAQQMQLGNIHTDTIRSASIGDQVLLNATLNFDQQKINAISSRVAGRIDKLFFKSIGEYVSKGARLFDLYSEELNNAKQEYLLALEKKKELGNSLIDFSQLVQGAENKLLLWGMSQAQINELARNKNAGSLTPFYSNAAGYITSLDIKEGDYIAEGGNVLRLADLSNLWAEAQVYSSQLSAIDMNGQALIRFPDVPGIEFKGRIEFVSPEISVDTRINLIRVSVPNGGGRLKPGMPAYVVIKSQPNNTLALPVDAVIRDGRGTSVWIQTGNKRFKNIMVETGREDKDRVEIKSGLNPGDIVVVSGAYLLNSEYIFKQGANPMEGMKM